MKVGTQTDTYICIFIVSLFTSLVAQRVKRLPAMQKTWVRSLGQEDPLEKAVTTHSSTLAWKIPWTEEPVTREPGRAPPCHAHGDLTALAPHERLPEILVVPREKTPTGAAARGNP